MAFQVEDDERFPFANLESHYLSKSSDFEGQEPASNYDEEEKDIEAEPEHQGYHIQFTDGLQSAGNSTYMILPSHFSLQATLKAEK